MTATDDRASVVITLSLAHATELDKLLRSEGARALAAATALDAATLDAIVLEVHNAVERTSVTLNDVGT